MSKKFIFIFSSSIFAYNFLLNSENICLNLGFRSAKHQIHKEYLDLPILETERLILRKLKMEDAQDVFSFTSDDKVEVCDPVDTCIGDTKKFIKNCIDCYKQLKPAPWAIEHKEDKRVVGYCGFFEFDPKNSRARIGYGLSRDYQNQGLMQEALESVLEFSFSSIKLNRIEAHTHIDTTRSIHLLEKVGMVYEGTLHEYEYIKDGFQDVKVFAILREHYLKKIKID